ncbi:MAG: hypothetical protein QXT19_01150 [Candidatus Woesearchaeota archaeon]
MAEKPVVAYAADEATIKDLMQRIIEKAAKDQKPLSFIVATAEHPLQELNLGKVIRNFLAEDNGRQEKDWVIRQAPERRYFVAVYADGNYLKGFTERLDHSLNAAGIRAYTSILSVEVQKRMPADIAEEVYSGLCAGASKPSGDVVFTEV